MPCIPLGKFLRIRFRKGKRTTRSDTLRDGREACVGLHPQMLQLGGFVLMS